MPPRNHRRALVALLATTILPPRVASAAPADLAAAETLFRQGRASVEAGDYPRACPAFAESLRLDPAPGTLLNLADCEEHVGRLASARGHFLRVEADLPPSDERRAIAHERAQALDPRVPRLTIALDPGAPGDARVFRDDVELGRSRLAVPLPVDPGAHTLLVVAVGCESRSVVVLAVERESVQVVVSPGPAVPHEEPVTPRSPTHTTAWIVGAGALAALGVGTYFGARALAERSLSDASCTRGACDAVGLGAYESARSDARASDVALGIAVVAFAVSGYLLLTSGRGEGARVGLRVGGSGLGGAW